MLRKILQTRCAIQPVLLYCAPFTFTDSKENP